MALVVLLRGVNVGGHRRFRPSECARALRQFDVGNIGAAGTFVVRRPGNRARFRQALAPRLPLATEVVIFEGRELLRIVRDHPFGSAPPAAGEVRFAVIYARPARLRSTPPLQLPPAGEWRVRILATQGRFVFGCYRRHMETIRYLNRLDDLCAARGTVRNWNTITAIARALRPLAKHQGRGNCPAGRN